MTKNKSAFINRPLLCYQQFRGEGEPRQPFEVRVEKDLGMYWAVRYEGKDGREIRRKINKGCCSSLALSPEYGKEGGRRRATLKKNIRRRQPLKPKIKVRTR